MTQKLPKKGELSIKAEEKASDYGKTSCQFDICANFKKTYNKLFFVISKAAGENKYTPVFKSECKKVLKSQYQWNTVLSNTHLIANDQDDNLVQIAVYEHNTSGNHKSVTKFFFSLGELKKSQTLELTSTQGNLTLKNVSIQTRHTFIDYIFGGCELGLTVAIDFTASNGLPQQPHSLHNLDTGSN